MEYVKCTICGEFGFNDTHKCPPCWETQIEDCQAEDEWYPTYAINESEAATKRAEKYDEFDHDLLDGEEITIRVREPGAATFKRFVCYGEAVPEYYAKEVE